MARRINKNVKSTKTLSILFKIILCVFIIFILFHITKFIFMEYIYPIKFEGFVKNASREASVDPYLIYAIIKTESGFNEYAISRKNAKGLMQVLEDTSNEINKKNNLGYTDIDLYNAATNITIGTVYFSSLISKYGGNYYLAICAYNAGMGNVDKWLDQGIINLNLNNNDNIPFSETKSYLKKVISNYKMYKILYK